LESFEFLWSLLNEKGLPRFKVGQVKVHENREVTLLDVSVNIVRSHHKVNSFQGANGVLHSVSHVGLSAEIK
jgi:hypothetical protein